jgi:HAD superfamily hydrolase (TIGR01490 family)
MGWDWMEFKFKNSQKGAAFFDLDGTLIRGLMIRSFPRYLADMGKIDGKMADQIDLIVSAYERGKISYTEIAKRIPVLYASSIKGLRTDFIQEIARDFVGEYVPKNLFSYSMGLIKSAKDLFHLVIAISGSPQEVVGEVKDCLGFDEAYGSLFSTNKNGVYTGTVKRNLMLGKGKVRLLEGLADSLGIDLSNSAAFGDTEQDEPILRRVGYPIAMNPNDKLLKICLKNGWAWYNEEKPPQLDSFQVARRGSKLISRERDLHEEVNS